MFNKGQLPYMQINKQTTKADCQAAKNTASWLLLAWFPKHSLMQFEITLKLYTSLIEIAILE